MDTSTRAINSKNNTMITLLFFNYLAISEIASPNSPNFLSLNTAFHLKFTLSFSSLLHLFHKIYIKLCEVQKKYAYITNKLMQD